MVEGREYANDPDIEYEAFFRHFERWCCLYLFLLFTFFWKCDYVFFAGICPGFVHVQA